MPVFKVDIEKQLGTEFWTNVYYCNVADLSLGVLFAQSMVSVERLVHSSEVLVTRLRVSDNAPGTDVTRTVPINQSGQRAATGAYLPLFNVFRIDLGVAVGRPSRKYIRGPVYETDQENGILLPAVETLLEDAYTNFLDGSPQGPFWTDVDGQAIEQVALNRTVGMRQLRRGSKRRATPVLP